MEKVSMSASLLQEMANSTEVVGREQIGWDWGVILKSEVSPFLIDNPRGGLGKCVKISTT